MSSYYYPGSRNDFYNEFGGLPERGLSLQNIFVLFIIVIIIMIVVLVVALLLTKTKTATSDHSGFFNLDLLTDLNNPTVQCCVFPGSGAPNQEYVYDTVANITYARLKPSNIDIVCNSFPNPANCVAANTDSDGNIIPVATFAAKPYYTFEQGLFVGCDSTTVC